MSGAAIIPRDPHAEITAAMRDALRARWPNGQRLLAAFLVSRDVQACADLIAGQPVDRSRLREDELLAARAGRLAVLVSPAELLENV